MCPLITKNLNCYKMANYSQILNFKVSIELSWIRWSKKNEFLRTWYIELIISYWKISKSHNYTPLYNYTQLYTISPFWGYLYKLVKWYWSYWPLTKQTLYNRHFTVTTIHWTHLGMEYLTSQCFLYELYEGGRVGFSITFQTKL